MTSVFLQLNRSDAAACNRAFERILVQRQERQQQEQQQQLQNPLTAPKQQPIPDAARGQQPNNTGNSNTPPPPAPGKETLAVSELPKFFQYIGAVTSPETLDTILQQFQPPLKEDVTREDAMNMYGMWLRMVSVSEPPALGLLEQRRAKLKEGDDTTHWSDKISAYLGNTNAMLLRISRTMLVMIFTLVHWFSVFFRDADPTLRCGEVGIGLDAAHTVLLFVDLFIEYYSNEYRGDIERRLQDLEEDRINEWRKHQQGLRRQQALAAAMAAQAAEVEKKKHQHQQQEGGDQHKAPASSSSLAGGNNVPTPSSSVLGVRPLDESIYKATRFDALVAFLSIFCARPKNLLAIIALVPIDLFLCAGDAYVAATVLNHFRLLSVFRNFIEVNPTPAPVPLTAMFADIYYSLMPLWMMTYTFAVVCSIFAIVFIIFRNNNSIPEARSLDFLTAFYLVVQTFTTVGFGDIYFYGTAETWFAVVLVLIGMITNAAVIGSLVALIQLGNATLVRGDKIRETHAVLHYFSIPRLLQLEILGFQEHVLFSDVVSAFHADTEPLPPAMRDAMILQHRLDVLRQIRPFSQGSADELFFLAKELCCACFKPEEYLSCCSEPHHGIRILLFGLVDRLDSRGRYIKTLRSGDCFGLDGILSGKDEEFNHKALSYCDLLVISYDDFHNVLEALPKLRAWILPELKKIELEEEQDGLQQQQQQQDPDKKAQQTANNGNNNSMSSPGGIGAKVLRSPVSMIDTTGSNLSMVHDLRSELRVFRRGLQQLAMSPAVNK